MFGGGQQTSAGGSSGAGGGGVSDLLLGAGAAGGLGNGFGGDPTSSTSSAVAGASGGTSTSSSSFDLSADFPSLGGASNNGGSSNDQSSNGGSGGTGLAAALRQQQSLMAHQQMLSGQSKQQQQNNLYRMAMAGTNGGNFNMATEDFPALPGAPPSGAGGAVSSASTLLQQMNAQSNAVNSGFPSQSSVSRGQSNNSGAGLYGSGDLDSTGGSQLDGTGLLGGTGLGVGLGAGVLGGLQQSSGASQQTSSRGTTAGSVGSSGASGSGGASGAAAGSALSGDYGLLGLLGVIRMTDADRNALALGSDLTMLGLNVGSSEHIYNTFASPWSESTGSTKEPHYQLPQCYFMQPPALKTGHLSKFQLETLFYIFYALPKDVLQAYSAQELYSREWRYHGDLKLWFKRATASDGIPALSTGAAQYLYFDINTWERRVFNGNMNQNVTSGFLTEEDVRVKFPSS